MSKTAIETLIQYGFCNLLVVIGMAAAWALSPDVKAWIKRRGKLHLVFIVAAVSGFILSAGKKPVQNAGADAGIDLVGIYVEYDSTNNCTLGAVGYTAGMVYTTTPIAVRNHEWEEWRELSLSYAMIIGGATNSLSFVCAGNETTNKYWWVGVNRPDVNVETRGIELTRFVATSRAVHFEWTCDNTNATEYVIERRHHATAEPWMAICHTSATNATIIGFTVGESWDYRISSTYREGGED